MGFIEETQNVCNYSLANHIYALEKDLIQKNTLSLFKKNSYLFFIKDLPA